MSWSRVSVFFLLLLATSCLEGAAKHVEGLVEATDSPPDRDATTTSAPAKDVKQLDGGSTETGGDTDRQKASQATSGSDHELRKSCCDRGHQSIRQRGHCGGKARSYVRTLSLDRRQAKLCRLLFGACCYRASRVAKPTAPQTPKGEVKQLGGATSGDGEADQKEATGPAWKRRLEKRCCSAGKRSAAATPGACQSRARTVARKARARARGGARSAAKEVEGCSQIFMRCCNEVPIG